MSIINKMDRFLSDRDFKIIYVNNILNINNYLEIIDFNSCEIKLKYKDGVCIISGNNLCVSRMVDNEILIDGCIKSITLS